MYCKFSQMKIGMNNCFNLFNHKHHTKWLVGCHTSLFCWKLCVPTTYLLFEFNNTAVPRDLAEYIVLQFLAFNFYRYKIQQCLRIQFILN